MRYVIAREPHICVVCKKVIGKGQICIQSEGYGNLFYHDDCHTKRFGASIFHEPRMTKTVEDALKELAKFENGSLTEKDFKDKFGHYP